MKYLIFGKGYIGTILSKRLNGETVFAKSNLLDFNGITKELLEHRPDVVINTAGKTGRPNVDWCETHKLETVSSNVVGAYNLAQACLAQNQYVVTVGSGCVYDGDQGGKGFTEEDPANFTGSFYSQTKDWEQTLLKDLPNALTLRIRMPIDWEPNERNYIDKMSRYKKLLVGVKNSATVLDDLVAAIEFLSAKRKTGVYNVANLNPIGWEEFMDYYKQYVDPTHTYEPVSLEEMHATLTVAKRSTCTLCMDKLVKEGFQIREVHDALKDTFEKYAAAKKKEN